MGARHAPPEEQPASRTLPGKGTASLLHAARQGNRLSAAAGLPGGVGANQQAAGDSVRPHSTTGCQVAALEVDADRDMHGRANARTRAQAAGFTNSPTADICQLAPQLIKRRAAVRRHRTHCSSVDSVTPVLLIL